MHFIPYFAFNGPSVYDRFFFFFKCSLGFSYIHCLYIVCRCCWLIQAILLLSWVWVYWCFTSHVTIFQSYMWRHRCAGGLKKLYLRSGSQRHRHSTPTRDHLFIRWFRHTAPFSRLLRHAGDTEDVFSTWPLPPPPASSRGCFIVKM